MRYKLIITSMILSAAAVTATAEVRLPQIISDGMVVQRGRPVVLWGTADPGETVQVNARRLGKSKSYAKANATVTADNTGRWRAELPAMSAGAPYSITINDITINDVQPGDVYVCSGQSNMELQVSRVTDMFADEIASYENPMIRHFNVPNVAEFHEPKDDVAPTSWKPVTRENVMPMSATAYFFSKSLYEKTGVPVGIIRTCWGGTPVEAWISEESLKPFARAINDKRIYEDDGYRARVKALEAENYRRWESAMDNADPGLAGAVKWYAADYDDSDWTPTPLLSTDWGTDGLNPVNGSHWMRRHFTVDTDQAGKPATLRLGCIVDADSAWVNGTFVGNTTYQYPPRIYPIPAGVLHQGDNVVTVRVISQNGCPHFVPEKPYKVITGSGDIPLEGEWLYRQGTPMIQGPVMEFWHYKPTVLYNAMVHPLVQYPVDGVVWYQGESNVDRRNEYAELLKTMIADWRSAWGDDEMPFYIVELADYLPFDDTAGREAWAEMRRIQAQVADDTPGAALIPNQDLGEWNDIHPLNKKTLGERIAAKIADR